ncbi:type 1 glutamine amidotransferase family protein [Saccharibacillus kuerlensis]|uniref:Glutamine amidotransferase n=1 Tax=Saccharibacillus kuerlensis TaxID=459527 RepID=A0ABQ2L3X8_9BACL|nr:type 1 glutamine amidotransferase family protein [Saccharibacillus kuerlensis]GGO01687.1 glutamine amidotransferase [Saccharibacillus kuerlensis]
MTTNKQVWVWLTDGFADWEASYAIAELNKPETGYVVRTIAANSLPKKSMGGMQVLPDLSAAEEDSANIENSDLAMLILPGGTSWLDHNHDEAADLVRRCLKSGIPVAAICDATTFLGRIGVLDHYDHTGNSLEYLKSKASEYQGESRYIVAQSVSHELLITANGTAPLEFARLILLKLGMLDAAELDEWYNLFKNGYYPDAPQVIR